MIPVKSSNIAAIGYEAPASRLHVQFKDDDFIYEYEGVPYQVYSKMLFAKSKGQFHSEAIRNKFRFNKYRPIPPKL